MNPMIFVSIELFIYYTIVPTAIAYCLFICVQANTIIDTYWLCDHEPITECLQRYNNKEISIIIMKYIPA